MGTARKAPILRPFAGPRAAAVVREPAPMHFLALEHGSGWRVYRRELVPPQPDRRWSSRLGFLLAGAAVVAGLKVAAALTWSLL